eukprot:3050132-Karenia_brevis.AAC.1
MTQAPDKGKGCRGGHGALQGERAQGLGGGGETRPLSPPGDRLHFLRSVWFVATPQADENATGT